MSSFMVYKDSALFIFADPVPSSVPGTWCAGDYRLNELILLAKTPNYSYQMATESHLSTTSTKHNKDTATLTEVRDPPQMSKYWAPNG